MKNIIFFALLSACLITLSSCDKDNPSPDQVSEAVISIDAEQDIAYIENLISGVDEDVDAAVVEVASFGRSLGEDCPSKTWEEPRGTFPNTLTIDYGAACTGKNGRTRSGKIIVQISDSLRLVGSTRTVTFEDFSIDTVEIEGGKTWENLGIDEVEGTMTIGRTADLDLTFSDGSTASWSHDHQVTRSIFLVRDRPNVPKRIKQFKATLEVSGTSSGVNRDGISFASEITAPLYKPEDCFWFSSGVREVTRNGNTRTIDYGDGHCDRRAEVTLADGTIKNIQIRPMHLK